MPAAAGIASNCEHGEMDMWLANHVAGGNSHIHSNQEGTLHGSKDGCSHGTPSSRNHFW